MIMPMFIKIKSKRLRLAIVTWALLLPVCLTLASCLKKEQKSPDSVSLGYVTDDPEKLWGYIKDSSQALGQLSVCWDRKNTPVFPDAEKRIEQHLTERFKVAGITISGWTDCPNPIPSQVKPIRWENSSDISLGDAHTIGYLKDDDQKPMRLSFKGPKDWCPKASNYLNSNCLLNIALHEMGHVLGLHHELNRPDVSNEDYCKRKQMAGETQTLQIGSPDRYSVMNYCRLFTANDDNILLPLSFGDILTLKTLYRGPLAYIELPFEGDQEHIAQFTVSIENLPIAIVGRDIDYFQFTWALPTQKCNEDGKKWSQWIPVKQGIHLKDLPKPVNKYLYTPIKLCVVGKRKDREQLKVLATSLVLTFDKGESLIRRPF